MASKIFLFEQIFFGSTSRRVLSGMSSPPFVREFRALANSAKLIAGAPDFDMNHSRNGPIILVRSAGLFARQRNSAFASMISFLKEPTSVAIAAAQNCGYSGLRGVMPEDGAASLRRIAPVTLPGVRFFQVIFPFVRIRRVTSRWNTGGRRLLIRLRCHPNSIRLKLPRACQSPISRAVIDDNDLFDARFGQAPSR